MGENSKIGWTHHADPQEIFGAALPRLRLPLARRSKGESIDEIPEGLKIREFPN